MGTTTGSWRNLPPAIPESEVAQEVVEMPVVLQRQVATIQRTQKTLEVPQMQYGGKIVDVPVAEQHQVPTVSSRAESGGGATSSIS